MITAASRLPANSFFIEAMTKRARQLAQQHTACLTTACSTTYSLLNNMQLA
jgi:hypothetical protein